MTVYYVDSHTGSDSNNGKSENAAFASLKAIDTLKLKAGDSVLFAADSVFEGQLNVKFSGTEGNPITFGSYGDGEPPLIKGGEIGIYGSSRSYIVIEDIAITATKTNAIYAGNAHHWVVDNVTVSHTGTESRAGSISFQNSKDMTVTNSTITSVYGEGVWMKGVDGATITNTTVKNSLGHNADAIQINDSSNILVRGNHLDMSGETGSAKGVLVIVNAHGAVIDGNVLTGGGFGLGALGENIVIKGNDISGYGGYSWSYGIGLGQYVDAKNYTITGNYIHDGVWGVSISSPTGDNVARLNIDVFGNLFDDLTNSALKIDRPATGSFHDNIIDDGVKPATISAIVAALKNFVVHDNTTVEDVSSYIDSILGKPHTPTTEPTDTVVTPPVVDGHGSGNTDTGHEPAPTTPPVDHGTTESIPKPTPTPPPTPVVVDDVPLVVPKNTSLEAKDDKIHIGVSDGDLVVTGNILDNDHSGNGILSLRTFAGGRVGSESVIQGKHGTIHIQADGDFTYTLNEHSLSKTAATLTDKFQYKVSNTDHVDVGYLTVSIDSHALITQYGLDGMTM